MEIELTWDLIVVVFFAVVMAYSFIVGKDESVKIVIASYIAILSVQAAGNLLELLLGYSDTAADLLGFALERNVIAGIKLVLFMAMIIILSVRGGFEMQYARDIGGIWETVLIALFGVTTAGLLLTALLTFVAAKPLLDTTLSQAPLLSAILAESPLMQIMVDYQNIWFCLPAFILLGVGLFSQRGT